MLTPGSMGLGTARPGLANIGALIGTFTCLGNELYSNSMLRRYLYPSPTWLLVT